MCKINSSPQILYFWDYMYTSRKYFLNGPEGYTPNSWVWVPLGGRGWQCELVGGKGIPTWSAVGEDNTFRDIWGERLKGEVWKKGEEEGKLFKKINWRQGIRSKQWKMNNEGNHWRRRKGGKRAWTELNSLWGKRNNSQSPEMGRRRLRTDTNTDELWAVEGKGNVEGGRVIFLMHGHGDGCPLSVLKFLLTFLLESSARLSFTGFTSPPAHMSKWALSLPTLLSESVSLECSEVRSIHCEEYLYFFFPLGRPLHGSQIAEYGVFS